MAKSRKSRSRKTRSTRVVRYNTNRNTRINRLRLIENVSLSDRRFHYPDRLKPVLSGVSGRRASLRAADKRVLDRRYGYRQTHERPVVAFQAPSKVHLCVRRGVRREVMFANGKTGKGGQRRPRYNVHSKISCKR